MKIEPKYKDGEPVCDEENCTAATEGDCDWPLDMLMDSDKKPCIPALCRDRDQAIKERDEARREICEVASESALNEGLAISPKMMARQRGWDYCDTPPKEQPK